MSNYVKPIQPTPTLSGRDARVIINQALTAPNKQSIERNEKRLVEAKKVFK